VEQLRDHHNRECDAETQSEDVGTREWNAKQQAAALVILLDAPI
jgi:hypothetical protein